MTAASTAMTVFRTAAIGVTTVSLIGLFAEPASASAIAGNVVNGATAIGGFAVDTASLFTEAGSSVLNEATAGATGAAGAVPSAAATGIAVPQGAEVISGGITGSPEL